MSWIVRAAVVLGFAASFATAQHAAGFTYHWFDGANSLVPTSYNGSPFSAVSYAHRAGAGNGEIEVLNRIDSDDHPFWGIDASGNHRSRGMVVVIQDSDASTPESFGLVVRGEDPARPNSPDLTAPILTVGPLPLPAGMAGAAATIFSVTFPQPVTAPAGVDLFFGVSLPASPNWPQDGLSTWVTTADPRAVTRDVPGRTGQPGGAVARDTYVCSVTTSGGQPTGGAQFRGPIAQNAFDVLVDVASGIPITRTNQASYLVSGGARVGTSNMLSGLHPDVFDANGTGRVDDLGFVFVDPRCANGPVFAAFAFGPSAAAPQPVLTFPGVPRGSSGVLCLDVATVDLSLAFRLADGLGAAVFSLPLGPPGSPPRAFVAQNPGLELYWQGFGVERGGLGGIAGIHASGCSVVRP